MLIALRATFHRSTSAGIIVFMFSEEGYIAQAYIQFCDSHVLSETYIFVLSFCLKKHKVIKDLLVKKTQRCFIQVAGVATI